MSDPERVHFVAIGGTGMGSLAGLLAARGVRVTGSDTGLYPPMSTALERWGIPVCDGFAAENLPGGDDAPDLVVIGNAVRADNPEARAAIDGGLPFRSFSDALYELAIASRHSVVVAGTHGKTTTTNLTAFLLRETGRDPSLLVGGISLDFDGSFREGQGEHFVVEGDEYDTAFFDKTPKFLHYHPQTLILTSVEFDHADIYRDLDHVKEAFRSLVAVMPGDGTIVAAVDHPNVRDVLEDASCRVVSYGTDAGDGEASWVARNLAPTACGTEFVLEVQGRDPVSMITPGFGRFNVENALGALAAVVSLGVPQSDAAAALPRLRGVKRRQELRGEVAGVAVIDDFAHHPTAVRGSIAALRDQYPGRRIVALFEPRTNTSRRALFQEEYAEALAGADTAWIREVPDEPIYSATGEVGERLSSEKLTRSLRDRGVPARSLADVDDLARSVASDAREGDVVLVMSNGAFGNIWEKLLTELRSA